MVRGLKLMKSEKLHTTCNNSRIKFFDHKYAAILYESALAASNQNVQSSIHKKWIAKINYIIIIWWYHNDFDKLYDISFLLQILLLIKFIL